MATLRSSGHGYDWRREQTEADYRTGLDAGPDIVLSDYHLPRFNGLRALTLLRERGLDIPFILVSGAIREAEAEEVLRQGADDVLLKDQLSRLPVVIQVALERRRLRDTLLQNEARLQAFLDNSPAPTFIKDTAGHYLHVNPRFLQAFGLDESTVLGRTDAEIFGGAQAAAFQGHDRQVLEAGIAMTFEEQALYVDGLHSSLVTKFPLRYPSGAIYALGGVATDITERNSAEQRYRATLEHAPIGIVHTALDGRVVDANPAACSILGYARSELLARNLNDITHPADRETSVHNRNELTVDGAPNTSSSEKRFIRKDGSVIWAEASVARVRQAGNEPDYFVAMIQDVSSRRAAEQQFRTTFEQATVGIVHTTLDDRYLLANSRFCEM
ncbi:MAG: PAS domain S-box protein, partial [Burkholderiales bacterium]|nr:PAS domain S-box protein [Burkholderiales bacterium]